MKHYESFDYRNLDPILSSTIRLSVVSFLYSYGEAEFTLIKRKTGASDGNLSRHLSKLEENGFITVRKVFKGKKPVTYQSLSDKGRISFLNYIQHLTVLTEKSSGEEESN